MHTRNASPNIDVHIHVLHDITWTHECVSLPLRSIKKRYTKFQKLSTPYLSCHASTESVVKTDLVWRPFTPNCRYLSWWFKFLDSPYLNGPNHLQFEEALGGIFERPLDRLDLSPSARPGEESGWLPVGYPNTPHASHGSLTLYSPLPMGLKGLSLTTC